MAQSNDPVAAQVNMTVRKITNVVRNMSLKDPYKPATADNLVDGGSSCTVQLHSDTMPPDSPFSGATIHLFVGDEKKFADFAPGKRFKMLLTASN